jgi:hypothetical protein
MRDPLAVFLAMSTQWRWTSVGQAGVIRTGLDYSVLATVASSLDVQWSSALFNDIRLMEREALTAWSD